MKTAAIFGSSGLIGKSILLKLLKSDNYSRVKAFVRSEIEIDHPKLDIIITDFSKLDEIEYLLNADECYFCIGTTRRKTPRKTDYIKIEYELPIKIAEICKRNAINKFIYISSLGASPNAAGLYLKNKGKTESDLKNLKFKKLIIVRPSILVGERKENRIGEKLGLLIMNSLSILLMGKLKKYKPIKAMVVANSIFKIANKNIEKEIFESDELVEIEKE